MLDRKLLRNLDYKSILAMIGILVMSTIMVYSASSNISPVNPRYFLYKHIISIAVGLAVFAASLTISYEKLARWHWHIYGVTLLLLLAVLVLGRTTKGHQSWIGIGPVVFQPSELGKVLVIVSYARFLASRKGKIASWRSLLPCFAYFIPPLLLIMGEPDLGSAMVFVAIMFGMLFIASERPKRVGAILAGGFGAAVAALLAHFRLGLPMPLADYQLMRFVVFLNPYNDGRGGYGWGYNVIQSQVAVGSGGLWGKGLLQGTQTQLNFLPEQHTDFIFSVVAEEWGLAGAGILLALYFYLIFRMLRISMEAKDTYGTLLAVGVVTMITFHILINAGMNIGIMPVTGIPLPMFSFGGSSMITNLLAIGLVLNVNLRRQKIVF